MKKRIFFITLAVLSIGFFTACEDDEFAVGPSIEFIAGTGNITADATVIAGEDFTFKWIVTKGDANLESFTIRLTNSDLTGFPKTDIDNDLYQDEYTTSIVSAGINDYTFIATDKDGKQETYTITVTATAVVSYGAITTYSDKIIGSYDATEGSSFASVNGLVYNSADAAANSEKIDFVYYFGITTNATLASPTDTDAQTVFSGISAWTTKNATLLGATTITGTAFDAMTDDADIVTAATELTASKSGNLSTGDVIAFETASMQKGLIKVTNIETGAAGTIEITVKVQE